MSLVRSRQGCCVDKACTGETCMNLPKGTTCDDCAHMDRCAKIFGHGPADEVCDWFPRRFLPLAKAGAP